MIIDGHKFNGETKLTLFLKPTATEETVEYHVEKEVVVGEKNGRSMFALIRYISKSGIPQEFAQMNPKMFAIIVADYITECVVGASYSLEQFNRARQKPLFLDGTGVFASVFTRKNTQYSQRIGYYCEIYTNGTTTSKEKEVENNDAQSITVSRKSGDEKSKSSS